MMSNGDIPNGWRSCDGSTDTGYGETDFCRTAPDFRSRVPIGLDTDRDGERTSRKSDDLLATGGRREFTLAEGDVPSHNHDFTHDHSYGFSHTHTTANHQH